MKRHRLAGLALICIVYLLAGLLAVRVYQITAGLPLVSSVLIADIAATVFVYLAGLLLKNASVYDPYWSVAPIVIVTFLAFELDSLNAGTFILLLLIWLWGIRLTANWVLTFGGLGQQDWRYDWLRRRTGEWYPLVSLGGIHLFPTLVVFFALLPAVHYVQQARITPVTVAGYAVCLGATTLQWMADVQLHRHKHTRADHSQVLSSGIWAICRHPNYLGEIMMWWGIYIIMLSARPGLWYLAAGALLNTLMFLVISIPMAEKRLTQRKPAYKDYAANTPVLLPAWRRHK